MRTRTILRAGRRWRVAVLALLTTTMLWAGGGTALAQEVPEDDPIRLVNQDRPFIERKKDGRFVARPVFDRKPAALTYALRHPDTGEWITAPYEVKGREKRLSDGWERSFEYPGHHDHPDLDPGNVYVLVLAAVDEAFGDPRRFYAVVPVYEPTGWMDRLVSALDPSKWAKAVARWIVEGVHGTLCSVIERATGVKPADCEKHS